MRSRVPVGHFEGDHVIVVDPDGDRTRVEVFARTEFIDEYWDYRPGEHATFMAMTGEGKTTLIYQLVAAAATPKTPAYAMITKPRPAGSLGQTKLPIDPTHKHWLVGMDWPVVDGYPPTMVNKIKKPSGYGIWPHHVYDPEIDDARLKAIFRTALLDRYKRGRSIVIVDEGLDMMDLGLHNEMRVMHTRGRSGGSGVFEGSQAPVQIGTWAFTQATHLFSGNIPDRRYKARLDEISGLDTGMYRAVLSCLPQYHFAYARQRGRVICAVGP